MFFAKDFTRVLSGVGVKLSEASESWKPVTLMGGIVFVMEFNFPKVLNFQEAV